MSTDEREALVARLRAACCDETGLFDQRALDAHVERIADDVERALTNPVARRRVPRTPPVPAITTYRGFTLHHSAREIVMRDKAGAIVGTFTSMPQIRQHAKYLLNGHG